MRTTTSSCLTALAGAVVATLALAGCSGAADATGTDTGTGTAADPEIAALVPDDTAAGGATAGGAATGGVPVPPA